MATKDLHVAQAKHNEELAGKLLREPPFQDWAITAAFYAAIHYFEAWLTSQPEAHTETSVPIGSDGRADYSFHRWREILLERKQKQAQWKAFRHLRDSSEQARYLSLRDSKNTPLPKPASEFFTPQGAAKIVGQLAVFKWNMFGPAGC